ncbi:uncharacterized protein PV09_09253 [Verruconis gallopava]|uniref:Zn(2)-C6 fungal-type domain-containing protein n=1 Tax=Verruconis gallopava TaxID=253628 RepID=A0A0D1ZX73_9PEZI|nr:uncharacterized protein PV09_09253 [Verruconis gallopava]KIV99027.1 hypothetical protein PV09_09253 [Verruconis gallopava]
MASTPSLRRKRPFSEIESLGDTEIQACFDCFKNSRTCVVMSSSKGTRCASCTRKGISCVGQSWESLDKTREKTKSAINEDLKRLEKVSAELAEIQSRLSRNRVLLEFAEKRAKEKAICLMEELEQEEEEERARNGGLTDGELRELADNLAVSTQAVGNQEVSNVSDSHDGIAITQADS